MASRHPPDKPTLWWWISHFWRLGFREPHEIITRRGTGDYLLRWFLLPSFKYFRFYLHKFVAPDEVEAMHDHPRASLSIILWGQYDEITPGNCKYFDGMRCKCSAAKRREVRTRYRWLSVIYRPAEYVHRIELVNNRPVWTLFIMGPKTRDWGFHCKEGWKYWEDFHANLELGKQGCD